MFSTNASQVSTAANYIEDVFSTYLYTGNSSTQTITNGIDLSTNGGLVWIKSRSIAGTSNTLFDTVRGATKYLNTNATGAQGTASDTLTAFNSTGFTLGADNVQGFGDVNDSTRTYASWTFREQAKFFDVVTYTGDGSGGGQAISHALGSTPGFVVVKRLTSGTTDQSTWWCWHRIFNTGQRIALNTTAAAVSTNGQNYFGNGNVAVDPTATTLQIGPLLNSSSATYVAYLFAHNAGGFGLTGNDNVISCGFFTTDGSGNATVNLGYEPQWVLHRIYDTTDNWKILDNMRGMSLTQAQLLLPNTSGAEVAAGSTMLSPTATGFNAVNITTNATYIYIAIRRGPMKVPTSGTSVFSLNTYTGTNASTLALNSNIVSDAYIVKRRTGSTSGWKWMERLISYPDIGSYSNPTALDSTSTAAESNSATWSFSRNKNYNYDYFEVGQDTAGNWSVSGSTYTNYAIKRAPGFFDEVCYTGTGSATTFSHNLGVVPEFMIVKRRDSINSWLCYQSALGNDRQISLNLSSAVGGSSITPWNSTTPTNAVFSVGTNAGTNAAGGTYVNYLFATCPGVSKVGSYTGTGATQTIDCGFTGGARFVLIKRTDSTGDWYVWDTARGMVSGTDPSLLLNSTAAEVNANSVYTTGVGFQIVSTAAGINASGGTYIFLAIA